MPRASTIRRLSDIAEEQWGLVTRRQAEELAGIPPATFARLAGDGSLLGRVAHGVYHVAGAPPPDHVELRAAWLHSQSRAFPLAGSSDEEAFYRVL